MRKFADNRGYFCERFNEAEFMKLGLNLKPVQVNCSRSATNVIRGLHYQLNPPQGKFVTVSAGEIWDVAVDVRKSSSTFGKWQAFHLSESNGHALWIPPGFAHGFCVLQGPADVMYFVDQFWNPASEGAINWNDRDLLVEWPVRDPILSEKDKAAKSFEEFRSLV